MNSRGDPTLEVDVVLSDGSLGRYSVPSGASTGSNEAVELLDGDPKRYHSRGVLKAIENIHKQIAPAVIGRSPMDQQAIDSLLIDLDGTPNKARLGANAVLAVSMATACAAAQSEAKPLYAYLRGDSPPTLPVPMFNVINGGRHAEDSTDIQEFMVIPAGFPTFSQALRAGAEVYQALKGLLREEGMSTALGDEGGFAPSVSSNCEAVQLLVAAVERAGYVPGDHCFIGLDVAASELRLDNGLYALRREATTMSSDKLIELYETWTDEYPIVSVEDGIEEEDWVGWRTMTARLGNSLQLVGDDVFATNAARIRQGIGLDAGNAVLIKPNQIGTLTETLEVVTIAKEAGWGTVISHRSGETEDTSIADLSVATSAGQIKAGAPARGERTAKYNRLLRIEEELGGEAAFAGRAVYERLLRHRGPLGASRSDTAPKAPNDR